MDKMLLAQRHQVTVAAAYSFFVVLVAIDLCAFGHESVYAPIADGLSDPAITEWTETGFDNHSTADMHGPLLAPTIAINGDRFVSSVPKRSWYAETELVAFRAKYSGVDFRDDDGNDKYNGALRLNLGWESESGFGIRGRLWGYEIEGKTPVASTVFFAGGFSTMRGFDFRGAAPTGGLLGSTSNNFSLGAGSFDLDFYKRFEAGPTDLMIGTGLRIAALIFETAGVAEDTIATGGISFFSELRHVFRQTDVSEWAFVGGARVAWLSGEWENRQISASTNTYDANLMTSEASLGLEWKRDLGWGALSLRSQYEIQRWDSDVTSDVAFDGVAVRVGLSW